MHCMLMDLLHGFEVLSTTEETFLFYFCIFLGLKSCEMARPGGSRPMPNLARFNIATFSIISALSVGPAVKFLPC